MHDPRAKASVWGTTHKTLPQLAAFANGAMVRYLDYNDTYLSLEPAHPSDNISAAVAVTQSTGRGGRDLILATVIGYELQCRMCDAASLRAGGWDHVTYGALSTASGRVQVDWTVGGSGDETVLVLDWCEVGGPALEAQPVPGFGSRLLRQTIAHELAGQLDLRFEREGVCCTMTIPLEPAGREAA